MTLLSLYVRLVTRFHDDESGAVTAEYGIVLLAVVAASLAAMALLTPGFTTLYTHVKTVLAGL
jgi:Flp pilus assembly pilin Flp